MLRTILTERRHARHRSSGTAIAAAHAAEALPVLLTPTLTAHPARRHWLGDQVPAKGVAK